MSLLSEILDFLNAKIAVIAAIAIAASIFVVLPHSILDTEKIANYSAIWHPLLVFILLAAWAYLIPKFAVFLFKEGSLVIKKIHDRRCALNYLGSASSVRMGELMILISQKNKNECRFIIEGNDSFCRSLYAKGLLRPVKWTSGVGQEYEIPRFVWNSKQLDKIIKKYHPKIAEILEKP